MQSLTARRLQAVVAVVPLALCRLAPLLLLALACDQHHGDGHRHASPPRPRHPGDTDHAILRFEPGSEVYYPEVVLRDRHVENGAAANASLDDRRHLKKRFRRRVLRRCGVAEPSTREVASSLKVLDDWEARNPGRRRSLLLGQDTQQIGTGPGEVVSNNSSTGAAPGADVAATAAPVILTVKVWWHVMKAGNTPRFGAWTRAQAAKSVQLANRYFAGSPFRFVLAGVTQSVNAEWFQCKFDDDYATELEYKSSLRREGADTLNVYMCDLRGGQGLWGFAYFPTALEDWAVYDGIVMSNPFTRGDGATALDAHMTFIHEAGHWLGLYHTWAGQCNPTNGGDTVHDTAAHVEETWGYDGWQNCFRGRTYNTCPDNVKGVDPGLDPLFNHMNYVPTPCQAKKGRFTGGQMVTMVSKFEYYRYNKTTCRRRNVPCRRPWHCCSAVCHNVTLRCL